MSERTMRAFAAAPGDDIPFIKEQITEEVFKPGAHTGVSIAFITSHEKR